MKRRRARTEILQVIEPADAVLLVQVVVHLIGDIPIIRRVALGTYIVVETSP
jgi:hypothetical protein